MRIKRSLQLWPESANVHLYWRCHNREFYLQDNNAKDLYMKCIDDSLEYKKQGENCHIHAYCVMNNHFHQSVTYLKGSTHLSRFMRYAHGLFGARYNRKKGRSGKVAEGRPKTPRVQNNYHAMRLHFYIEANPIRAKFRTLENLKGYIYSSYGFYAYGIRTRFTGRLTIPEWYLSLGQTMRERQRKYRKLFREYIEKDVKPLQGIFLKRAIGDSLWVEGFLQELRNQLVAINTQLTNNQKPIFSG
jgi:putative transposase